MKMKKAKLFMMLALLVMGVSNAFADYEYYKVVFAGLDGADQSSAGYGLRTTEHPYTYNGLTNNNPTVGYISGYNMYNYYYGQLLSSSNVQDYIAPYTIMGYSVSSMTVSTRTSRERIGNQNYDVYTITITYEKQTDFIKWNDGTFEYCNYYMQSTGNIRKLPDNEIAIRLYLGDTDTVKDSVWYNNAHNTGRQSDDDGDDVGQYATFTSLGQHALSTGGSKYFYARDHQVACSKKTSVTIPATVTVPTDKGFPAALAGKVRNVTAIQKWGFCYNQCHVKYISNCTSPHTTTNVTDTQHWWAHDDHSNWYLRSVDFESPSKLKYIGDYAFMSCTKLKSVNLPNTLVYMGDGVFEMCEVLDDPKFQAGVYELKVIRNYTFWMCTAMQTLELPDGIEEIMGSQSGAAMQYMLSLKNVSLPNTLKTIGPHFLCCAGSLETLTIPASVEYIDAACFHGCENLHEVYMLGPVNALQPGDGDSKTFGENHTFCKDYVENCTFYTTPDYLPGYAGNSSWAKIADNRQGNKLLDKDGNVLDITINGSGDGHGNKLLAIEEIKRTFEAGKWVTAIFPNPLKHKFAGDQTETTGYAVFDDPNAGTDAKKKCRVARMTGATTTTGIDQGTGETIRIYSLTYQLVDEDDFETGVPYLFCPGRKVEDYVMVTIENMADAQFKQDMTNTHEYFVYSDNGPGQVLMKGKYVPYKMMPWDFYFSYQKPDGKTENTGAMFYRVPDADNAATAGATRCYWTVNVNGIRTNAGAKPASNRFFDDTTGIDDIKTKVVIEGVYDLNGRKLDINPENLPQGMFIINGKKVMINK